MSFEDNLADPLTMAVAQPEHDGHVKSYKTQMVEWMALGQVGDC